MQMWHDLVKEDQLDEVEAHSYERPQLIFKHSTRCGISYQVKNMLFSATDELSGRVDLHYLDLIAHRNTSNQAASKLGVPHQSPQVILIRNGEVVYHSSHFAINPNDILVAAA